MKNLDEKPFDKVPNPVDWYKRMRGSLSSDLSSPVFVPAI